LNENANARQFPFWIMVKHVKIKPDVETDSVI